MGRNGTTADGSARLRRHGTPCLGAMRSRAGITLIEMLVVMVVIGLMAAISFPAASAGIDSIRINSASQSTAAFLNAALTRVERRQEPVELVISPGVNTMRTY